MSRDGRTVGKDGTTNDPVGVTVGDTVTNTVEVTVPNKQAAGAVKFKLIDQPKGQTYVQGSLSVRLKNAPRTDITADAVIYDGTTQNNTVHTYGTFTDGIRFTTITDQDKVDIKAYDFTLRKVDAGQREHAARRRPVPDPAQRQVDEARPEPQSDPTRPPGGGELSCKPYLGPILHTIGTAVFIHGTSPKGTERR